MPVIETPFILHPTLERITPPDALRPYTPIPNGRPNDKQNGMFSPIDWKKIRQEELSKQTPPKETAKSKTVAGANPKPKTNKQKSDEAAQKNKDWVAQYRQKLAGAKTPLDPVSVDSQVNVALRDPVYGQATATGLTMGNNILNTWINAHNADARREAEELKNERWLKQLADAEEDKQYQRKWNEEERDYRRSQDREYLPEIDFDEEPLFVSDKVRAEDARLRNDPRAKGGVFTDRIAYQKALNDQRKLQKEMENNLKSEPQTIIPDKPAIADNEDILAPMENEIEYGNTSGNNWWNRIWNSSFRNKIARTLDGDQSTHSFSSPSQLINRLMANNREKEARQVKTEFDKLRSEGIRIKEIVSGTGKGDIVFVNTSAGVYKLTPNGLRPAQQLSME